MNGQLLNIHPELMDVLLKLEKRMGIELTINSGYRTPEHNASPTVGGVVGSEHTYSPAQGADIHILRSATRFKLVKLAFELGITRIGIGDTFVHVGIARDKPREVLWLYGKKQDEPPAVQQAAKEV